MLNGSLTDMAVNLRGIKFPAEVDHIPPSLPLTTMAAHFVACLLCRSPVEKKHRIVVRTVAGWSDMGNDLRVVFSFMDDLNAIQNVALPWYACRSCKTALFGDSRREKGGASVANERGGIASSLIEQFGLTDTAPGAVSHRRTRARGQAYIKVRS